MKKTILSSTLIAFLISHIYAQFDTLVWSQTPVYEWFIHEVSTAIGRIKSPKKYGIFNQVKRTFWVYGERVDNIGSLKWLDDW